MWLESKCCSGRQKEENPSTMAVLTEITSSPQDCILKSNEDAAMPVWTQDEKERLEENG